jgi:hypothetical protein
MNNITLIEFVLVGAIVVIQTLQALSTRKKIIFLRSIIPSLDFFEIKKYNIPLEELKTFQPKEILQNLSYYEPKSKIIPEPIFSDNGEPTPELLFQETESVVLEEEITNEVSLINPNGKSNPIFEEILQSVNVYLLRNKGAVTDFNLIKDIIERNIDAEDDDINQTATIPLYLGLMGTMLGIVFGLINLFIVSDTNKDFEIQGFLGGVSIAMFASFYGLAWTVYNASFKFKDARRIVEKSKNNFYTFIQTELLPILNQSISSSVYNLHTNLIKFNDNFSVNLNKLTGLLHKNHDALIAQERILQSLEKIDITEFAKANVKVLKELKTGTEHLDRFNQYLNALNYLANGTTQLSTSFESLLARVNNFQGLAEKLDTRVEESNKLVQFLNDHFQILDDRGELIRDTVIKVEDIMIKTLGQLEEHTQTKIDAIKQITVKEEDLMTQSFAENRSHFSKLSLLVDLKKSIEEIKINSTSQINSIKDELKSVKDSIERTNTVLKSINSSSLVYRTQSVAKSIKQLFTSTK